MSYAIIGFQESHQLLKFIDLWLKSDGGIYVDMGFHYGYDHPKSEERKEDIYVLGSPGEKITMKDISKMFKNVEKYSNIASKTRTCYYEGIIAEKRKMIDKSGKEITTKFSFAWGT